MPKGEMWMSYAVKKGAAAVASATKEEQDFSKAIFSLKSGSSVKVRIPSKEEVAEVMMVSVYKTFHSTPSTPGDLYGQLSSALYDAAKNETDEKKAEELREKARLIKKKPRYLFGFYNLADGQPIIIDLSKKQAQVIFAATAKFEKKLDSKAFEISKSGSGTSTTITIMPLDEEDLTADEAKHFEETKGKTIDDAIYENCLYVKDKDEQLKDLQAFANNYDINLADYGIEVGADTGDDEATPIEVDDEDLPF